MNVLLIAAALSQVPILDPPGLPALEYRQPIPQLEVRGRPSVNDISSRATSTASNAGVVTASAAESELARISRLYPSSTQHTDATGTVWKRVGDSWKPYNRAGGGSQTTPTLRSAVRPALIVSPPRSAYSPFPSAMWGGRMYTGRVCNSPNCRM